MKNFVYGLAALVIIALAAPIASAEEMKSDMKEGGMMHHRMHHEKGMHHEMRMHHEMGMHHEMRMHHHHTTKKEMKKEM